MKRIVSCVLTLALAFAALLPGMAQAKVISGYTSKVDYANTDANRYQIDIDLVNQVITVYERDSSGAYTNIVLQGLCTTGNAENPTGAGTFKLGHLKERFGYFVAFGQYAQYWTQIIRGIYIHSIMYDSKDLTKLSKSAYNGLGKALSHGCVRVLPEHAQWIFYNCPPGTTCVISKNRAQNPALVKLLKEQKPSYSSLYHIVDTKADPAILTATVKADSAPVRTGFSSSRDTTVVTLGYGEQVKLLQIGPDWCKVQTAKDKLGYMKTQYLQFDPDGSDNRVTYSYIASENTALYQTASTKAAQLVAIPKGASVSVIGTRDKFWFTAYVDGQFGYVRSRYVKQSQGSVAYPEIPALQEGSTQIGQGGANATIKQGIVANFRSGPGMDYEVIGEIQEGVAVTLLAVEGNWYYVDVNGLKGYISAVCIDF